MDLTAVWTLLLLAPCIFSHNLQSGWEKKPEGRKFWLRFRQTSVLRSREGMVLGLCKHRHLDSWLTRTQNTTLEQEADRHFKDHSLVNYLHHKGLTSQRSHDLPKEHLGTTCSNTRASWGHFRFQPITHSSHGLLCHLFAEDTSTLHPFWTSSLNLHFLSPQQRGSTSSRFSPPNMPQWPPSTQAAPSSRAQVRVLAIIPTCFFFPHLQ